jgi:CheY-like chemotaxis protein
VLLNLVGNAVKFTKQGEVAILVHMTSGPSVQEGSTLALRFEVRDTGPGLSEEQIGRLFRPFTQLDSSSTRRHGGTGLGLAISGRLVELMGGQIGVASAPGQGSTFWFSVPLAAAGSASPPASGTTPTPPAAVNWTLPPAATVNGNGDHAASPPTILLVEDNLVNQKVALRQLQKLGYAVAVATNGREGVEMALRGRYALLLMDCQMPEMDGYEATRAIRAAERDAGRYTPIVAMTANAMEGDREACLAAGMDDYLAKPLRMEDLGAMIGRWTLEGAVREASR